MADDPMIGRKLAHFRVLEKLGEGGMGVVYRAEDERLRREVALKMLPPDLSSEPERRERFLREARAAAAVSDSGIAAIHDIGEEDGIAFIAMELVHDYIYSSGAGDPRPQFPSDLSRKDRARISEYFKLWPQHGWGEPRKGFDYEKYFRHLPVADLNAAVEGPKTDWDHFARLAPGDPAWDAIHLSNDTDTFGVPALWVFSWYDVSVAPNVALYEHAREHTSTERAKGNQHMIIGPLPHCQFGEEKKESKVGDRELGDARFDYVGRLSRRQAFPRPEADDLALRRPSGRRDRGLAGGARSAGAQWVRAARAEPARPVLLWRSQKEYADQSQSFVVSLDSSSAS